MGGNRKKFKKQMRERQVYDEERDSGRQLAFGPDSECNREGDRVCTCADCGEQYVLTVGEQKWYAEKGYPEPKRCKDCRAKRKAEKESRGEQ